MNFLITLLNGLSIGGIYAMIALGYTMVYGIAKMLNFAHGDIMMAGGYAIFVFLGMTGNWIAALAISVVLTVLLGICIERVAYKPLRGASPLAVLITAIGVSYLLQSLAQIVFGSGSTRVNVGSDLGTVGDIEVASLITLGCTVLVMVGLHTFIRFSKTGRAMLAVSEDRSAAALMGINVNFIIMVTFAIGSALAVLASLFNFMNGIYLSPSFGALPGIKAFTAAVIGGIGSIPGAMLGGVLLGVIECFSNSIPALNPYTDAIEFAILIVILLVRPSGILGKKRREKV